MAIGLLLEFEGIGREHYEAVNRSLGLNPADPTGNWPAGLIFHAGGATEGGWAVFEVWDSSESQEHFMRERLAKALQEGGVSKPPMRVQWLALGGHVVPKR